MQSLEEIIKIGEAFIDSGRHQKAIDYFTEAIDKYPPNSVVFELRGIAFFRLFSFAEALKDTSTAIEIDGNNYRAWYNKGEIFRYKKQYAEAEECYAVANTLYPGSLFYLTGLIQTTKAQKKYKEAIIYCNQILNETPGDWIALSYRGMCYAGILDYNAAIKDYLKLLDLGKRKGSVYNCLGFWYSKIGDLKRAENNLSVAIQFNACDAYAIDNLGHVFYLKGDYDKALKLINESLQLDPSNSYGYKNRALVYIKLNQKQEALYDLNTAKTLGYAEFYDNEVEVLLNNLSLGLLDG